MVKKRFQNRQVLVFLVSILIIFSGCVTQELKEEETMLPSLQTSDLRSMQEAGLSWFDEEINATTGFLKNQSQHDQLIEYIHTALVLYSNKESNQSYNGILNNTLNSIFDYYAQEKSNLTVSSKAELLILLTTLDDIIKNKRTATELVSEIIKQLDKNYTFSKIGLLSPDAATLFHAIISYDQTYQNKIVSKIVNQSVDRYQFLIENTIKNIQNSNEIENYTLHYFTDAFKTYSNTYQNRTNISVLIINSNILLSTYQETNEIDRLGQYQIYSSENTLSNHLDSLKHTITAYALSKNLDQKQNMSTLKQSVILGLIYVKNLLAENTLASLQKEDILNILLILNQAQKILPQENYTYLWDSTHQMLLEGRSLETSPTLWVLLTIGVMGSIGLLALVYVLIQLYYKNKQP